MSLERGGRITAVILACSRRGRGREGISGRNMCLLALSRRSLTMSSRSWQLSWRTTPQESSQRWAAQGLRLSRYALDSKHCCTDEVVVSVRGLLVTDGRSCAAGCSDSRSLRSPSFCQAAAQSCRYRQCLWQGLTFGPRDPISMATLHEKLKNYCRTALHQIPRHGQASNTWSTS